MPQVAIWMVFITIFMDTLAATISTPALPYYARSFHVNNAAVGSQKRNLLCSLMLSDCIPSTHDATTLAVSPPFHVGVFSGRYRFQLLIKTHVLRD